MKKKIYLTPEIDLTQLDNEISLVLQSILPTEGPEESLLKDEFRMITIVKTIIS